MVKKSLAIGMLAVALVSVNSYGQQRGGGPGPGGHRGEIFDKMDTDSDGKLSKAEIEAVKDDRPLLYENFDKIDSDKDGYLQKTEMRDFMQQNRPKGGRNRRSRGE